MKMNILLSNDDGYLAPGIQRLFSALRQADFVRRVVMIAPESNRSASSSSLTLRNPLRLEKVGEDRYCVNGTPSDCVHLGVNGVLADFRPDMVVSGINAGFNLGDDVLYSGTVAAAVEGRFLGYPSLAVSLEEKGDLNAAVGWTLNLLAHIDTLPASDDMVLNMNVPGCAADRIEGLRITRLGRRHQSEPVICDRDPRGENIYWIGPPGQAADDGEGTDFHAVARRWVSLTPLTVDMTNHALRTPLQIWADRWEDDEMSKTDRT